MITRYLRGYDPEEYVDIMHIETHLCQGEALIKLVVSSSCEEGFKIVYANGAYIGDDHKLVFFLSENA